MKIAVADIVYIGLAKAVLLAQDNEVVALDINSERVDLINRMLSPIEDVEIGEYLQKRKLNLRTTTDKVQAYSGAYFVIIATPTDYDPDKLYYL
jgi:UDPglucose 6-dehydrogenase